MIQSRVLLLALLPALAPVPPVPPAPQDPEAESQGTDRAEELRAAAAQHMERLRLLDQAGLSSEIVARYTRLVTGVGSLARDGEAVAIVARATFEGGDENRARQLLTNAATGPQTQVRVKLQLVRFQIEQDQLTQALDGLTIVQRNGQRELRYPREAESWLLLARIHARLEQYDQASPAAVRFLAQEPRHRESSAAWHILAQAAIKTHDADHARTCRERAEELSTWYGLLKARSIQVLRHPEDPLPRLGIALLWMQAQDYERAREELLLLTRRFPEFCRGWFHLGEAERLGFDDYDALDAYDQALACDPEHAPARMNRSVLALDLERPEEAQAGFERLIATEAGSDARYAGAHLFLARIYAAAGEDDRAAASFARYRELGGTETLEGQ